MAIKKVQVVPVVMDALGSVTKDFDKWMEKLGKYQEMLE